MATLKPMDGAHLVRDLLRAPDFAIVRMLSDGKPRTPVEVYRGMQGYSNATAVAAFTRLRKNGIAKPVPSGKRVSWKLDEDVNAVLGKLMEHQQTLEKVVTSKKQ